MTPQNDLAHRLIRRAARSAPSALACRLEEEWSADLATRTGVASRLRLAVGCWWATTVITREFAVPQVIAASPGGSARTFLADAQYGLPRLSRRTVTFLAIAGVHLLLIYGFSTGLAQHFAASLPPTARGFVIVEPRPQRPPTPVPAINLRPPPIDQVVIPEVLEPTNFEPDPVATGPDVTVGPGVHDDPPHAPPVMQRLQGGPGKGFPNTDDFYPSASRRLAESGATTVQVCVDTRGVLASEPVVTQSSGIPRLDDGALKLARAGSGHYRPTTENGQPVSACYPYRIRFRLND